MVENTPKHTHDLVIKAIENEHLSYSGTFSLQNTSFAEVNKFIWNQLNEIHENPAAEINKINQFQHQNKQILVLILKLLPQTKTSKKKNKAKFTH